MLLGYTTWSKTLLLSCLVFSQVHGLTFKKWKDESWNKAPGFKARVTQHGLDFLRDVGLQMIAADIEQITIPDIHGTTDVSVLGDVDYDVTNMHITSFSIPSASLTTDPAAGGLVLKASGVQLSLHGDWHYDCWLASDSGDFDISAWSIYLGLTMRITVDDTGRPFIASQPSDCSFQIGELDVDLHGGLSWLYDLFADDIADEIQDSLNSQACQTIVNAVNTDLENKMKTLQMVTPFLDAAEIDYSLVESPHFNGTVNTAHKGEVYPLGKKTECPLPVPQIPADPDVSRMAFLWITDYLPNSAGYVLHNVGYLQYNVTPDNVPDSAKAYLNTSNFAFKLAIPQIGKMYPNMAMQFNLNSTVPPVVAVNADGIKAQLKGDWSPYAILPNKTLAYLFTVNVTINAAVTLGFKENNVTWNLSSVSVDISLIRSDVGTFKTALLEAGINTAVALYLKPYFNQMGADGIAMPQIQGLTFTNPVITQGKGFVKIGTDLNYTAVTEESTGRHQKMAPI